jgi:hypothetical protein
MKKIEIIYPSIFLLFFVINYIIFIEKVTINVFLSIFAIGIFFGMLSVRIAILLKKRKD